MIAGKRNFELNEMNALVAAMTIVLVLEIAFAADCALKLNREYSLNLYRQSRLWYQQAYLLHNFDLAKLCGQQAVRQARTLSEPSLFEAFAHEDLGNLALAAGDFSGSVTEFGAAIDDFKKQRDEQIYSGNFSREHMVNCYTGLTKALINLNQWKDAQDNCETGLRQSHLVDREGATRNVVDLNEYLGDIEQSKGNNQLALNAYNRALICARSSIACDDRVDELTEKVNRMKRETAVLQTQGEVAQTTDAKGVGSSAKAKIQAGDYQGAVDQLTSLIKQKPDKARLYRLRAQAYEKLKKYDDALNDWNACLKIIERPAILEARARVYSKLNKPMLAKGDLKRAELLRVENSPVKNSAEEE